MIDFLKNYTVLHSWDGVISCTVVLVVDWREGEVIFKVMSIVCGWIKVEQFFCKWPNFPQAVCGGEFPHIE